MQGVVQNGVGDIRGRLHRADDAGARRRRAGRRAQPRARCRPARRGDRQRDRPPPSTRSAHHRQHRSQPRQHGGPADAGRARIPGPEVGAAMHHHRPVPPRLPAALRRASAWPASAAPFPLNLAAIGEAAAAAPPTTTRRWSASSCTAATTTPTRDPLRRASYDVYARCAPPSRTPREQLGRDRCSPDDGAGRRPAVRAEPKLAPLMPLFDAGQAGAAPQRRHAGGADHQGAVHAHSACRCRPSSSRTTTSRPSGRRPRPRARPRAGAGSIGDLLQTATATRTLTCINGLRQRRLPVGRTARQYEVSTSGPVPLRATRNVYGSTAC